MTPFETLVAVRNRYPALIQTAQCVAILNEVCWLHRAEGLGLLLKTAGNHAAQPRTGTLCSVDWIVNHGTGMGGDCLINTPSVDEGDVPRPATPTWNASDLFDIARFVAPVLPEGAPVPPDPPQPPDPPVSDLEERVTALETDVATLHVALTVLASQLRDETATRAAADAALDARLTALEVPTGAGAEWGDPVYTSGTLSLTDALRGRTVTWTGKIGPAPTK